MSETDLKVVALIPSGKVNPFILQVLAGHIQGLLSLPVDVLPSLAPPQDAFHPVRKQYNAAAVLQLLAAAEIRHFRVLGVASYDLFLPIFTHVYGEAQAPGRAAVVSLFRLDPSLDGAPTADRETFLIRCAKVAVHELLHTFGLVHCRHTECLMRAVTKLPDLDSLAFQLCRSCRIFMADTFRNMEIPGVMPGPS